MSLAVTLTSPGPDVKASQESRSEARRQPRPTAGLPSGSLNDTQLPCRLTPCQNPYLWRAHRMHADNGSRRMRRMRPLRLARARALAARALIDVLLSGSKVFP